VHTRSTTSINNREINGMKNKKKNEYDNNKAEPKKKQIILLSK